MKRGLALILVVGILAVLAVLGSAFAVLSRMERRASALRIQGTRALLLARSGMDDARARLDAGQDPAYGGEDWDGSSGLNGIEIAAEVYRTGALDTEACPVRHALRPSFFTCSSEDLGADLKPAPRRIQSDGRERGYSGLLAGGTWTVRARPSGGFYVNGGDPAAASTVGYNAVLKRMLGVLAEAIDREDGAADNVPVGPADGQNLVLLRPASGWRSLEQVRSMALGGSQIKLDALREYLVLSAWTDKKVVAPNLPAGSSGKHYRLLRSLRTANWVNDWEMDEYYEWMVTPRSCPDLERIPPTNAFTGVPGGRIVGRAPVDLAWARTRRPSLIALLGGIRGCFWQEGYDPVTEGIGRTAPVELQLDWGAASDDCRTVADGILASTSDLATWEEWNAFCDALPLSGTGTTDLAQAKKDLLKAHFNPNTDANKFNPEASMRKLVDKADLLVRTTELHLGPSRAWRIAACGRSSGRASATRELSSETFPDRLFTLTTQAELTAGSLGNPDLPLDESSFRAYGAASYITPSSGPLKTHGHKLTALGGRGTSLQTYPDNPLPWELGIYPRPPSWDGQLKLATVETGDGSYAGSGAMRFLARWDDGFDADYGGGPDLSLATPYDDLQSAPGDSVWPDFRYAPTHPISIYRSMPSSLHPDGNFIERRYGSMSYASDPDMVSGNVPGYYAPGNLSKDRGTISYWFKPAYDTRKHRDDGFPTPGVGSTHFNNTRTLADGSSAFFFIVPYTLKTLSVYGGTSTRGMGFGWEAYFQLDGSNDTHDEQARGTPLRNGFSQRWHLGTFFWDMKSPRSAAASAAACQIYVDRGQSVQDQCSPYSYGAEINNALLGNPPDFTAQQGGPAVFYLGGRTQSYPCSYVQYSPDGPLATFDEFAIYDLGLATGAVGDGPDLTGQLARFRFADGRYYKEDDGAWLSAPVDLGDVRLRSLSWTQIVPDGLKGRPLARIPAGTPVEDYDNPKDGSGSILEPDGRDGRILMEMTAFPGLRADARGERLGQRVRAPFRLHAVFQPRLADPLGKAILDPLTLDDVTVTYRPMDLPLFSAWREGE